MSDPHISNSGGLLLAAPPFCPRQGRTSYLSNFVMSSALGARRRHDR